MDVYFPKCGNDRFCSIPISTFLPARSVTHMLSVAKILRMSLAVLFLMSGGSLGAEGAEISGLSSGGNGNGARDAFMLLPEARFICVVCVFFRMFSFQAVRERWHIIGKKLINIV